MRVIITGAAGRIGSQIVEELSQSHELHLIDRRPLSGKKSIVADVSQPAIRSDWCRLFWPKRPFWTQAFKGAEVVVHLAANIHTSAPWETVLPDNIQGTWNVFHAAAQNRVSRVVFASSNWAVKASERQLAPDVYFPNGPKIDSDAPPCPGTVYGLSKAFGELTGRMFVDEERLMSFVAVRIGHYSPEPPKNVELSTRWIGAQDIRKLFRRCVEAKFTGFHVVYGVSAQPSAPYDLSHTSRLLSWKPKQLPS